MICAVLIKMIGCAMTVLFTRGYYMGLPPIVFVCLTSTVTDTLYNAWEALPALVLFAKLIPENVESSMFAMLTGLLNFGNLVASKELAILINKFVGVYFYSSTDNTLYLVWQLYVI